MEGKVHYCDWEPEQDGFRVFVLRHKHWSASGETFQEAVEALEEIIGAATADGEVQLEFVNGTPDIPLSPSTEQFVSVYGAGDCDGPREQPGLYEGGYCSVCGNPMGGRTRERRVATLLPNGDGALNPDWNPIFSERFLSLLSSDELTNLDFIEVVPPKRSKKIFYELVGKSVGGFVAKKGEPSSSGKCAKCGFHEIYYATDNALIRYLSLTSFGADVPSCFAAGSNGSISLGMRLSRWRDLLGKPGTKQLRSSIIRLLNESDVDRNPQLRLFGTE